MYILVIIDVFSKFIKLYALKKATTRTCLGKIEKYIQEYGRPQGILSDNGPQFVSHRWKTKLHEWEIKEKHTSVRYPQGNPCERYIKVVGECLRILVKNRHNTWGLYLKQVEQCMNYNYNGSTGAVPVEEHFERSCQLEVEKWIQYPPVVKDVCWKNIKDRIVARMKGQAERRNKYQKIKTLGFRRGQLVLIRRSRISNKTKKLSGKLSALYAGPGEINKRLGVNTYLVKMNRKTKNYHLYPYVMRSKSGGHEDREFLGGVRMMKIAENEEKGGKLEWAEVLTEEDQARINKWKGAMENVWTNKKEKWKNKKMV